jgi:SAM-dependent methyltransferase
MTSGKDKIENSYNRVARHYAAEYLDELGRKPFDCELLDQFAATVRGDGEVCEIGCGPGQIARYLKDRGVNMRGIDVSEEMVRLAADLNPDIPFEKGDMRELVLPSESLAGIACFYAIIHLKREEVVGALTEMNRTLTPNGRLLISFHGGQGELFRDEWYDTPVSIEITLFERDEMAGYLEAAGFNVERMLDRQHYDFEYPTRRMYAFGRKPALPVDN